MKVNFLEDLIPKTGKENMRTDLDILEKAIEQQSQGMTVRFYTWAPKCISLGKSQKSFISGIKDIDIVNRPTGGRALLHDKELTYSVVCPIKPAQKLIESYIEISDALILGFEKLGIKLDYARNTTKNLNYCMNISSGADVSYKGKKLIGSAQFRKRGYLLQHGSILLDADYELLEKIFMEKIDKEKITTLKEIAPNITIERLCKALKYGFETKFGH